MIDKKTGRFLKGNVPWNLRHGMKGTSTYKIWEAMKRRCISKKSKLYKYYGERGIKVCKRWYLFDNFLKDMGVRPNGKELDRINNDGNYEPKNCRWATKIEQANNTRRNRYLTYMGNKKSVAEWARLIGANYGKIMSRLNDNWTVEKTLTWS